MTFNSPNSPISMLHSVFTKLPDVLPANFYNIDWGEKEDSNSCDDLGYNYAIFRLFQGVLARMVTLPMVFILRI